MTAHVTPRQPMVRGPFGALFDRDRIRRAAVAIWLNLLVAAVVLVAAIATGPMVDGGRIDPPSWSTRAVTLFAVWLLSFVPGWLYIRFLGLRAGALWNEYVLTLYRLGVDEPASLPPPPDESAYASLPGANDGGHERSNIYRQKFNAYYGPKVSARRGDSADFRVSVDTLFPVFVCTATLAVCWTVVLWQPEHVVAPVGPWATLQFGFLGAYVFSVLMLVRRFYQSDLRPTAYASVVVRLIVVLLIHLDPATRDEIARARTRPAPPGGSGAHTRQALRRLGVRTATDLLRAFGTMCPDALRARGLDPAQIETVVRLLADEPALNPVWNWKGGGARRTVTPAVPPPPSAARASAHRPKRETTEVCGSTMRCRAQPVTAP